ncbi:uncharacterized protein LOC129722251 [Wyeomyia smithii]|uniref:uncharacterized protein LOC129722251 n=1 Tax=Wyeomyia smithii TaxID=174621 RepID=UPI0024681A66|nr:uncharacterized protein LOC129722251 [Wyeomyia smithii]XP_055531537.1 uncharacterized protein LOC129722251 [Wyeomyia smithii]XP_055531538.1 uncharacterized protein LOC129722251 [Wyeomyia smithii]
MDIFVPIAICFAVFVLFSLCGMCCRRNRDQGAIIARPVVITSTQHHVGPYPVSQTGATATVVPTAVGPAVVQQFYPTQQPHAASFNTTVTVYPTQQPLYPTQGPPPMQQQQLQQMPMPMPGSAPPVMTMPSVPAQSTINPPSYNEAVSESYAKQAPYNPHFSGQ